VVSSPVSRGRGVRETSGGLPASCAAAASAVVSVPHVKGRESSLSGRRLNRGCSDRGETSSLDSPSRVCLGEIFFRPLQKSGRRGNLAAGALGTTGRWPLCGCGDLNLLRLDGLKEFSTPGNRVAQVAHGSFLDVIHFASHIKKRTYAQNPAKTRAARRGRFLFAYTEAQ